MSIDPKDMTKKFAATLTELEQALQAWDQSMAQQTGAPDTATPVKPIYETKLIKELCRQLRELSKD